MSDRGLRIALILSIILNLFLIAAGVSAAVYVSHAFKERAFLRQPTPLASAARQLDPDLRDRLRKHMREQALAAAPDFREAREARRKAVELSGAQTFDRAAVAEQLAKARAAEDRGRTRIESALLDFMQDLKPEDRTRVAQVFKGRPRGMHGFGPGSGHAHDRGRDRGPDADDGPPPGPPPADAPPPPQ